MATSNSPVRYQDLIDGFSTRMTQLGTNIGAYASTVPNELRYPYTNTVPITVENGKTPKVVWTNSASIATVLSATVTTQFTDFCNAWLLTNNANANQPISTATVLKFITAVFAFIQCKFATVYSPFTTTTAVFYMQGNAVNSSYIYNNPNFQIDTTNVTNLVSTVCNSAINSTKGFNALQGYSLLRQ